MVIKGSNWSMSKNSATRSSNNAGAKGRNHARCFTRELIRSLIATSRGSAKIERFPSARGPTSEPQHPYDRPADYQRMIKRQGCLAEPADRLAEDAKLCEHRGTVIVCLLCAISGHKCPASYWL